MSMFEMKVSHQELGDGVVVVRVVGEVDVYTHPTLRNYLREHVSLEAPPRHVAVDLTECLFLDSCGLGVLVGLLKQLRSHSDVTFWVIASEERMTKLFRITGLTKVFPVVESTGALLEQVRAPQPEGPTGEGGSAEEKCA